MQDIKLTSYLQELWLRAYNGEHFIIDYSDKPEGVIQTNGFYNALANYRKSIRKSKLNPLYSEEWSRIQRCELVKLSNTCFYLTRKHSLLFSRKRKQLDNKLPFNSFKLPDSVVHL